MIIIGHPIAQDSFVNAKLKLFLLVNIPACLDLVKEVENTQQMVLKREKLASEVWEGEDGLRSKIICCYRLIIKHK